MDDTGVDLKKDGIPYPAILPSGKFHRVIAFEAEMNVFMEVPVPIHCPATLITSRRGNFNPASLQIGEGKKAARFSNQVKVPTIRKVIKEGNSAERIDHHPLHCTILLGLRLKNGFVGETDEKLVAFQWLAAATLPPLGMAVPQVGE